MAYPLLTNTYRPSSAPLPELSADANELSSPSDQKTKNISQRFFDRLPSTPSPHFPFYHLASKTPSPHCHLKRMPSIQEDTLPVSTSEKLQELTIEQTSFQRIQDGACNCFLDQPNNNVWKAYQRGAPIPEELLRAL